MKERQSASELSRYIVDKCIADGNPVTNMQLQKILYYIQKEFLKNGSQAFPDSIEAWAWGAVIPNVYYDFCGFGSMPISFNYSNVIELSADDSKVINKIIEEKRSLNPWDLTDKCWEKVYNNGKGDHAIIPISLMIHNLSF